MQFHSCFYDFAAFIGHFISGTFRQFLHVGRNKVSTVIFGPVFSLGIDKDGDTRSFYGMNDLSGYFIRQNAFMIIRQNDTIQTGTNADIKPGGKFCRFQVIERCYFFKIETHHLLTCSKDTHFCCRCMMAAGHHAGSVNSRFIKKASQKACIVIIANQTGKIHIAIQISQIRCHIGSPAQDRFNMVNTVHWYRSFW